MVNKSLSIPANFLKSPFWRVFLHIGFWALYLSTPFFAYLEGDFTAWTYYILIVANLFYLPFYYAVAYVLVPKYFNRKKWYFFAVYVLAAYLLFSWACKSVEMLFFDKLVTAHEKEIFTTAIERRLLDAAEFARMIIVTLIPLSIMMMRRYLSVSAERSKLIKMNTDLELNFLKSQINPHFLFNTLNNIYSLSLQKSDRSPDMILKLSDLMRYMLYECNVPLIALNREIKFLEDYIELEKIRHGEKAQINFEVTGATNDAKIPPLLLIPFVENAFKHGINAQLGNAWVHILLNLDAANNGFIFQIENNKPPVNESKSNASGGIGIENAKKRLQMIYPGLHLLTITDEPGIYRVNLNISKL